MKPPELTTLDTNGSSEVDHLVAELAKRGNLMMASGKDTGIDEYLRDIETMLSEFHDNLAIGPAVLAAFRVGHTFTRSAWVVAQIDKGIDVAKRTGDAYLLSALQLVAGASAVDTRDYSLAMRIFIEGLSHALATDQRVQAAKFCGNICNLLSALGLYADSITNIQRGRAFLDGAADVANPNDAASVDVATLRYYLDVHPCSPTSVWGNIAKRLLGLLTRSTSAVTHGMQTR